MSLSIFSTSTFPIFDRQNSTLSNSLLLATIYSSGFYLRNQTCILFSRLAVYRLHLLTHIMLGNILHERRLPKDNLGGFTSNCGVINTRFFARTRFIAHIVGFWIRYASTICSHSAISLSAMVLWNRHVSELYLLLLTTPDPLLRCHLMVLIC